MTTLAVLGAALLVAAPTPSAQEAPEREVAFPDLQLVLTLPELDGLSGGTRPGGQTRGQWQGRLGPSRVEISLLHLDWGFSEPDDVVGELADSMRRRGTPHEVVEEWYPTGPFGTASFATAQKAALPAEDGAEAPAGTQYLLGGLLGSDGYVVLIQCRPRPEPAAAAPLRQFLEEGIRYEGEERDPEWTLEEIRARWLRDAPEDLHEEFVEGLARRGTRRKIVIRTDHYIVLTNSSGGSSFARQMERNYDEIRDIFPFGEVEGRRLMPVFLFRTSEQYYDFYVRVTSASREAAERSKGHAWRDYYATWYESPRDPVHIHEATHQIFSNRLQLHGGGSWYQEGVAEYVETAENDRNAVARLVEKGRHTPLDKFFTIRSLLHSAEEDRLRGGSEAADHYTQAALFIEFLRESRFGRDRFEEFLFAMGKTPRGDLERIAALFEEIYGVTIAELDEEFQQYCARR